MTSVTWNLVSVHLETMLLSVQDRCTVCAKCIIGSEIIIDDQMVLLSNVAQMEARFGLFGDSANLNAR